VAHRKQAFEAKIPRFQEFFASRKIIGTDLSQRTNAYGSDQLGFQALELFFADGALIPQFRQTRKFIRQIGARRIIRRPRCLALQRVGTKRLSPHVPRVHPQISSRTIPTSGIRQIQYHQPE
jgi:hypothetical protein